MSTNMSTTLFGAFVVTQKEAKRRGLQFELDLTYVQKLIDAYSEPWRRYHTLAHIEDGCKKLLALWDELDDPVSTMFAWLHHDIVYLTTVNQGENEERSAQVVEALADKVDAIVIKRAAAIIRATNGHLLPDKFPGNMNDLAVVLDVDLSGFGDVRKDFIETGELLREEFGLDEEAWSVGRGKFAEMLLSRPKVFKTKHFAHLEPLAQDNLKWAIAQAS